MIPSVIGSCAARFKVGDRAPNHAFNRTLSGRVFAPPAAPVDLVSLGRMAELRFSVFGTLVAIERADTGWLPFLLGPDGKRRRAEFKVPQFVTEAKLCQYLADLFHESASPAHPEVYRLK